MTYPRIIIDTKKIRHNVKTVVRIANENGMNVAGVTKGFCAHKDIVRMFVQGGVMYLTDARIINLKKLEEFNIPKLLSRLPMLSEVQDVVRYSDYSLNSELITMQALSYEALRLNKIHGVIIMVDLGDLREGYFKEEEIYEVIKKINNLEGIKLAGIGTNLTCYGGLIPNKKLLNRLISIGEKIEDMFDMKLEIISGGNSSTIHLLKTDKLEGINNLRLGESIMCGTESAYGELIPETYNDAFTLEAEIIEIKDKPSVPDGEIGKDSFGKTPSFIDRGIRKRIICAIGKQDTDFETIDPIDKGLIVLGGSSDHLILDGSDSPIDYKIGDIIKFNMHYVSILRAMTSEYVDKLII
ncbi:ornithine racemase Orr [Tissierella sp. Yu-01]|uniref:ornithine racemase Orr n=1 Tax=Tissierella sp. Yu-01 TaxID=3035694 RepID=UPI00240D96D5|nr:ornithine racemase Orr [Tissierella sp. Yu-01]WFA09645.1 ornithine racemase Orr [Tissierella sp. Yu-01]